MSNDTRPTWAHKILCFAIVALGSIAWAGTARAYDQNLHTFFGAAGEASAGSGYTHMVTGVHGHITVPAKPPRDGQSDAYWIGVEDQWGTYVLQPVLYWDSANNRWEIFAERNYGSGYNISAIYNVNPGDSIDMEVWVNTMNLSTCVDNWGVYISDDTTGQSLEKFWDEPCNGNPEAGNSFNVFQELQHVKSCSDTPSAAIDSIVVWYGNGSVTQFLNYPFNSGSANSFSSNLPNNSCTYSATISDQKVSFTN